MKSKYYLLILLGIFFLGSVCDVSAQGYDYFDNSDSAELNQIKREISSLLAENTKLTAEYDNLRREYFDLKNRSEDVVYEIKSMEKKSSEAEENVGKRSKELSVLRQSLREMNDSSLITKSRVALIKGKVIDFEEKLNLRRLQLKELELKKRELEVELDYKKAVNASKEERNKKRMDKVKNDFLESEKRKKLLESTIISKKSKMSKARADINRLMIENKSLEEKVLAAKKDKEYKAKMMVFLKDRRTIVVKEQELLLWDDEYKKVVLTEEVKNLKKEHDELTIKMKASLASQTKKRGLLDKIMGVDKENQKLRRKIADLEKTIELTK